MQLTTNAYSDPSHLVEHLQHLKSVNFLKDPYFSSTRFMWNEQPHWYLPQDKMKIMCITKKRKKKSWTGFQTSVQSSVGVAVWMRAWVDSSTCSDGNKQECHVLETPHWWVTLILSWLSDFSSMFFHPSPLDLHPPPHAPLTHRTHFEPTQVTFRLALCPRPTHPSDPVTTGSLPRPPSHPLTPHLSTHCPTLPLAFCHRSQSKPPMTAFKMLKWA